MGWLRRKGLVACFVLASTAVVGGIFFILPAFGLSNAAATLVGQNLGAGHIARAEESVYVTARYSAILMAVVTALFFCFADPIVRVFTQDEQVAAYGIRALQIIASGYVFYGIAMVLTQALNGAGDTKTPTWINFVCFWIFQTPFAYFLAKNTDLNVAGAVVAIPVSQALLVAIAWVYFRKGKWKELKI